MSIENKVPMSNFTEVTEISDTARIIGLQDNENVKIPLQSLIAKTLSRVDEDILTIHDINMENGVTGFEPIGEVKEGDLRAVSGNEVFDELGYISSLSKNLLNKNLIIGILYSVSSDNKVKKDSNVNRIGIDLRVKESTDYFLSGYGPDSTSAKKVIFSNESDEVLGFIDAQGFNGKITTPIGCSVIYINIATSTNIGQNPTDNQFSNSVQLVVGTIELPYENYGRVLDFKLKNDSVNYSNIKENLSRKIANEVISDKNIFYKNNILNWESKKGASYFNIKSRYAINDNGDFENYIIENGVINLTDKFSEINLSNELELSFSTNIDTSKDYGALIGLTPLDSESPLLRILIGYEPSRKAISTYVGGQFYDLLNIVENKKYSIKVLFSINKVVVTIDNTQYDLSNYTIIDTSKLKYIRLQLKQAVLGNILEDLKAVINYSSSSNIVYKKYSNQGSMVGRNTHIYKFGGQGNDWCFVRTPSNYNPNRDTPYPFVICNHGNGWTMNGNENRANFTEKTQFGVDTQDNGAFLDTSNPYYVEFSNETIERLLDSGFIVCGAQNYADNLYGNTNCRNATRDFFNHIISNYNVENRCHMLGASNGAMTSLNAMYLLGGITSVKSMILYYPLTCLWNQYNGYPSHQQQIENAYNIGSGLSEEDFKKETATHDPLNVNTILINGKSIKTTSIPPIKFSYSMQDTVTKAILNSIPLIEVLENTNCIVEKHIATGQHGDYTHFNPIEDVSFINKYN